MIIHSPGRNHTFLGVTALEAGENFGKILQHSFISLAQNDSILFFVLNDVHCVTGNHELLIGGNEGYLDLRLRK